MKAETELETDHFELNVTA